MEANNHLDTIKTVNKIDVLDFRKSLIKWGKENFRPFPWRLTEDPYHILMAEVMLHRTQAIQVVPVYKRFMELYPDLEVLTQVSKKQLHEMLQSLGLSWRINLISLMTHEIIIRFEGIIPCNKTDLLSLPGVGDYIASAVCCFAWNLSETLIDTNTVRVVGRIFGLEIKDSSRRNPIFKQLLAKLIDPKEPRNFNYALLDLANKLCTKRQPPSCSSCPVMVHCLYGINNSK